jgi:hypothetical protein
MTLDDEELIVEDGEVVTLHSLDKSSGNGIATKANGKRGKIRFDSAVT